MFRADEREIIRQNALSAYGAANHKRIIRNIRIVRIAPFAAAALLIGGAGYVLHRAWTAIDLPEAEAPGQVIAAVPLLLWLALAVAALGGVWVRARGRVLAPGTRVVRAAVTLLALAALTAFWLGAR